MTVDGPPGRGERGEGVAADRAIADARRYWDQYAGRYDRALRHERLLFGDSRDWVCRQAAGDTLEVAVGTGLNLDRYPRDVRLTGVDLSPGMLAVARQRAAAAGIGVRLLEADAQRLPFPGDAFDTVVCTLGLCAVPDLAATVAELWRVLRPDGRLLLLDHVRPDAHPLRWLLGGLQRAQDRVAPGSGERFLRRPLEAVVARGFQVERAERLRAGLVERLAARKPA